MQDHHRRRAVAITLAALALGQASCIGHGPGKRAGAMGGHGAEATVPTPSCTAAELPGTRVWRLTHAQLRTTLLDVFGFAGPAVDALPPDARLEGFANGSDALGIPPLLLEYYYKAADEVSTDVVRRAADVTGCPLAALDAGPCLGTFVKNVGLRAWRRPLTGDERARLVDIYRRAARAGGPELGLKLAVQALIVAPGFLFRYELGDTRTPGAVTRLDDYEIASALSYTLWDAPPDARLYELAAAHRLHEPETLRAEAARLLASPRRAPAALTSFVEQWLRTDGLPGAGKDPMLFPMYGPLTGRDLLEETRLLVGSVVFEPGGDRSLRTLLTANYGFVSGKTAKLYGLKKRGGGDFARMDFDRTQRRGILTHAAFLAAHADADITRVVDRGKFVREDILCGEVPPPPDEFKFDATKITDDMTGREKLTAHAKNPFCANCHALFDGIGFALESYDAVGQFRTTDKQKPIDPTGTLPLPGHATPLRFASFVDLVDQIARLREPYDCFALHYLGYATGRVVSQIPACERGPLLQGFAASGYRVDTLVLAVVNAPGFINRKVEARN